MAQIERKMVEHYQKESPINTHTHICIWWFIFAKMQLR